MRTWHYRIRTRNTAERNTLNAMKKINLIGSQMGLPNEVRENAAIIYRKVAELCICRGRNTESLIAAIIYASCRQSRIPRTLNEVAACTSFDSSKAKRKVGKSFRFLARTLNLGLIPSSPEDYVARYVDELNLDPDVKAQTIELLERSRLAGFVVGKNPRCMVAAAIYLSSRMCGKRTKQHDIGKALDITEVSIRNRYKEMVEKRDIDLRKNHQS